MARKIWFTVSLVLVILYINGVQSITKVTPVCADDPENEPSVVILLIDQPDVTSWLYCKGGNRFEMTATNEVNYTATVYGYGDPTSQCVFNEKRHAAVYYVKLSINFGNEINQQEKEVLITCSYGLHQKNETEQKNVGFGDEAPIEIVRNMGMSAASSFSMQVQSVVGRPLTGNIQLGRKIRLYAAASGAIGEVGITPVSCNAIGGAGYHYAILRGGCGDGIIFRKTQGFVTRGLKVRSPFFRAFKLRGSPVVFFECNFTVCASSCDGDSCVVASSGRKKREAGFDGIYDDTVLVHHKEQDNGMVLTVTGEATFINKPPSDKKPTIKQTATQKDPDQEEDRPFGILNKTITMVFLSMIGAAVLIGVVWVILNIKRQNRQEKMRLIETTDIGSMTM